MYTRRKALITLSTLCAGIGIHALAPVAQALPRTPQQLLDIAEHINDTGMVYGAISSLSQPNYIDVLDADLSLDDDEAVFIFSYPDAPEQQYIVQQRVLVWHEVLNEFHNNKTYCLTYSPISGTLAFFEASTKRINLFFDAAGTLYNNNSILIDRNTGSYWSQLLGLAYEGPLAGTGLKFLPVYWTTWKLAKKAYPDAMVMEHPKESGGRNYNRDPYGSYQKTDSYYQNSQIIYPLTHYDTRMPAKTQIYAIESNKALVAIDINYVREKKSVNFYLGPTALLAIYDETLDTIRVFDRHFWQDNKPGLFYYKDSKLQDYRTRSIWNIEGQCVSGKLEGASLKELFGFYSFWFSFAAINPETFTVPGDGVVPDSVFGEGSF